MFVQKLSDTKVYPWYRGRTAAYRGYFFFGDSYYEGDTALTFLEAHAEDLPQILPELSGSFAIIVQNGGQVLCACDRLRSLPLFYRVEDGALTVSDTARTLLRDGDQWDAAALELFRQSVLWVPGSKTLVHDIFGVQAGEYIVFAESTGTLRAQTYYAIEYGNYFTQDEAKNEFWPTYEKIGRELVQALRGRTAVIPLSGGADSRMILDLLVRQKYPRIFCFTYGRPGQGETAISEQIARDRGVPWHCVAHTKTTFTDLQKAGILQEYMRFADNFTSLPHLQDFAAVYHLKEEGLLPADSVFVPGHSGDMPAGSHITANFMAGSMLIGEYRQWFETKFYPLPEAGQVYEPPQAAGLADTVRKDSETLLTWSDQFNIRERQAKFIVNSVRVYEFFGYEWLIPLWHNAIFAYWSRVPLPERYGRKLYFSCVGQDVVSSTNDASAVKRLAAAVRRHKAAASLARRLVRAKEYFTNPLYISRLVSFPAYLGILAKGGEYETGNIMVQDLYLAQMKDAGLQEIKQ